MNSPTPTIENSKICPQCGGEADWKVSSWCSECGFYPAIGRLVETPEFELEEEAYEHWWQAVPFWLWVLIGGTVAIFVISLIVRVVFEESPVRLWWTLGQLTIGSVALFVAHLLAYLHGASRTDRVGPMDAFIKPLATWQPVLRSLPEKIHLLWTGTWSLTAIVLAFFVIDGIDYQAMADARQQADMENHGKSFNPIASAVRSAKMIAKARNRMPKSGTDPESIEKVLTDFSGEVGVEELQEELASELSKTGFTGDSGSPVATPNDRSNDAGRTKKPQSSLAERIASAESSGHRPSGKRRAEGPSDENSHAQGKSPADFTDKLLLIAELDLPAEEMECVVIGYTTNAEGEPRSLLLAAPVNKRLRFVAKVSLEQVEPEAYQGITERFPRLHQRYPVVGSPYGGRWLKPEIFCEVRYSSWTGGARLQDPYVTRIAVVPPTPSEGFDSTLVDP